MADYNVFHISHIFLIIVTINTILNNIYDFTFFMPKDKE